jgi:hypothetical protein
MTTPTSPARPQPVRITADDLDLPPVGAYVVPYGYHETVLVTEHTARGFKYSGANRICIPRLGIHGDGTGEFFLDVEGASWRFSATPTAPDLPADIKDRLIQVIDQRLTHDRFKLNIKELLLADIVSVIIPAPLPASEGETAWPDGHDATPRADTFMRLWSDYLSTTKIGNCVVTEAIGDFAKMERELAEAKRCWDSDNDVIVSLRREVATLTAQLTEANEKLEMQTTRVIEREERLEQMSASWDETKRLLGAAQAERDRLNGIINGMFPETAALHEILRQAGCVSVRQADYDELQSLRARLTAPSVTMDKLTSALGAMIQTAAIHGASPAELEIGHESLRHFTTPTQ